MSDPRTIHRAAAQWNGRPIWITGAGGLIGSWLAKVGPSATRIRPLTRAELELTSFADVERLFQIEKPGLVIHCAAMSRTHECQKNPELARKTNVEVTRHLAELASTIPFVFFSTDLVFDGRAGNYDESAPVNPVSIYGETKVAAELVVLRNPLHLVIRTSLNSGPSPKGDQSFDEDWHGKSKRGEELPLFTDEFRSPIPAKVTASAVWELVNVGCTGIWHVAGSERLSRWETGQILKAQWRDAEPKIVATSINAWAKLPPRTPDTSLNCAKAQALLSFPLPRWSEWVRIHGI